MRHRYRVDLYDDVVLEAQIADLVESMPRARRQEFLRTMIKVGYLNTYGAGADLPNASHYPSASKKDEGIGLLKDQNTPMTEPSLDKSSKTVKVDKKTDNSAAKQDHNSKGNDVSNENLPSQTDIINIPSINEGAGASPVSDLDLQNPSQQDHSDIDSHDGDGDIVDGLDEFNGLFDGLGES
jgi:hypothetical protein